MGAPVDITTDAAGFAIITLDYGQVVSQIHFSSTVASTAFDLLIEDQHNRGNLVANFTQWRDSNGTLKFDNVPITSLDPVVFSPQEMALLDDFISRLHRSAGDVGAALDAELPKTQRRLGQRRG